MAYTVTHGYNSCNLCPPITNWIKQYVRNDSRNSYKCLQARKLRSSYNLGNRSQLVGRAKPSHAHTAYRGRGNHRLGQFVVVRAIVRLFHSLRAPDSEGVVVAGLFLPVARGSPHLVVSAQLYRWSVNGTHCSIRRHHQKEKRVSQRDGICDGPIESAEACRECIHQRSVKAGSSGAFLFRCRGSPSVESGRMLDPATIQ